jgi:probable rRNA maturation factor
MILNRQRTVRIARPALESFLRRIRRQLRLGQTELNIAFVTDSEIARLNHVYRKKRGPTDVLSFPVVTRGRPRRASSFRTTPFLGDIAISPATARRNAKSAGRPLATELRILMLHGVLHLLGYDHEADTGQMDRLECDLRLKLGLS